MSDSPATQPDMQNGQASQGLRFSVELRWHCSRFSTSQDRAGRLFPHSLHVYLRLLTASSHGNYESFHSQIDRRQRRNVLMPINAPKAYIAVPIRLAFSALPLPFPPFKLLLSRSHLRLHLQNKIKGTQRIIQDGFVQSECTRL